MVGPQRSPGALPFGRWRSPRKISPGLFIVHERTSDDIVGGRLNSSPKRMSMSVKITARAEPAVAQETG